MGLDCNVKVSFSSFPLNFEQSFKQSIIGLQFNRLLDKKNISDYNIIDISNRVALLEVCEGIVENGGVGVAILSHVSSLKGQDIRLLFVVACKYEREKVIKSLKELISIDDFVVRLLSIKKSKQAEHFIMGYDNYKGYFVERKYNNMKGTSNNMEGHQDNLLKRFDYFTHAVVGDPSGLHARPAATLAQMVSKLDAEVFILKDGNEYNCNSIGSIMGAGIAGNSKVTIGAIGAQSRSAVEAVANLVSEQPETQNESTEEEFEGYPTFTHSVKALIGVSASPGIGIAPIYRYKVRRAEPKLFVEDRDLSINVATEEKRLRQAIKKGTDDLIAMAQRVVGDTDKATASIFEAHAGLLNDGELLNSILEHVRKGHTAEYAWVKTLENKITDFLNNDNSYIAERATDYRDLKIRIYNILVGNEEKVVIWPEYKFILVAKDLTPSQTAKLPKDKVIAIATSEGGPTAHSAILARALGIPAIVGVGSSLDILDEGQEVVLNGHDGFLEPEVSDGIRNKVIQIQQEYAEMQRKQNANRFKPSVTLDGRKVEVGVNSSSPDEVADALNCGAESIGLIRTELFFQEHQNMPTEEEQTEIFRQIAVQLEGRIALVRTFDIGADKPVPFLNMPKEENPFLGERGIRLTRNNSLLFNVQIASIMRAIKEHNFKAKIMLPMVSTVKEVIEALEVIERQRMIFGIEKISTGIMLEVPAAVVMIDVFSKYVDFFSIGTNDLTQYVMAVDRQHPTISKLADPLDPAVLRFIDMAVRSAHKNGKWVGVCGNMAADPINARILVGLGVDELSMGASSIPTIKNIIRNINYSKMSKLAQKALLCSTPEEVRGLV